MDVASAFQNLGISLGLGLLVGTQRERVDAPLAGVRTFALITLLGTLSGMLASALGAWIVAAGMVGVAITVVVGNLQYLKKGGGDAGITTEVAILLMYAIGAYLVFGHRPVAVVMGAGVAVLLHAKPITHGFVKRLGDTDMRVMMQFVLISLVILPVLPDRSYGPFGVLNPREIWWMVVVVVGISLAGYVALKLYGEHTGLILAGIIGGLVSSTATTVSFARRASTGEGQVAAPAMVIMLASTVVYVRVLLEVFIVAPRGFVAVAPPVALLLLASVLLCLVQWRMTRRGKVDLPAHDNPTELRPALVFGALYALVLLAVATASHYLGNRGVYFAAGISGLTDMDAITLGTSRMGARGVLPIGVVWRSIMIAILANLVFKSAIVSILGGPALGRRVAALFAIKIALGLGLLVWWPW
jgi:uncharacterized membrane protein (DUF4010 family)